MRLAGVLKTAYGVEAKLIPGSSGVFDVVIDGKKLFSKHDEGRFPEEDEIVELIEHPF